VAEAFEQGRMRADPAVEPPVVPRQAGVGDAMEDPVVRRDKGLVGSAAPVSLRAGGGGQSEEQQRGRRNDSEDPAACRAPIA
jgi:hypothetical protein